MYIRSENLKISQPISNYKLRLVIHNIGSLSACNCETVRLRTPINPQHGILEGLRYPLFSLLWLSCLVNYHFNVFLRFGKTHHVELPLVGSRDSRLRVGSDSKVEFIEDMI